MACQMPSSTIIRYNKIDCGIGKQVPITIVAEIWKKKVTHVSLHANNIHTLNVRFFHQKRLKNFKDADAEEAIRSGTSLLKNVQQLDLSSNCLHEGYALPSFPIPERVSLLGLCSNLLVLNLASNDINEHSFSNLISQCTQDADKASSSCLLPLLHTLDLSHNNFTEIPQQLCIICPSLRHLSLISNHIKSLTNLLRELYTFRGKMETFHLQESTNLNSTTNLVCSKELYREKIIFLLGPQFVKLDGLQINNHARDSILRKLEHELSTHNVNIIAHKTNLRNEHQIQQTTKVEFNKSTGVEDHGETQKKIKTLEAQVATLSATIGNCVSHTINCDDLKCQNKICQTVDINDNVKDVQFSNKDKETNIEKKELENSILHQREKAVSRVLLCLTLSQRQNKASVCVAFSLWLILTQFKRQTQLSKANLLHSEIKWTEQAKELVNQAVNNETEKSKQIIDSRTKLLEKSKEENLHLVHKVQDLEKSLQNERQHHQKCDVIFHETIDALKLDVHRLEAKLEKQISEYEKIDCHSKMLSETLAGERFCRTKMEQENIDLKIAYDKVTSSLKQMKLEVVSKEETIQSVKDACEKAAQQSAVDRSRCEQAMVAEQKAIDALHRQTILLGNMEGKMRYLVSNQLSVHSTEISELSHKLQEKDKYLHKLTTQLKATMAEQENLHTQLVNYERLKSHADEQNTHLEAQLNQALVRIKECLIEKEQFDKEKLCNKDLKHSLDMLHRTSQQREQNLISKHKEDVEVHKRMTKALSRNLQVSKREHTERAEQIKRRYCMEMQQITEAKQREVASIRENLDEERKIRVELEEKVSKLQSEISMHKLKMHNAINSMVNKLSET